MHTGIAMGARTYPEYPREVRREVVVADRGLTSCAAAAVSLALVAAGHSRYPQVLNLPDTSTLNNMKLPAYGTAQCLSGVGSKLGI
jgi:hypothetical protein